MLIQTIKILITNKMFFSAGNSPVLVDSLATSGGRCNMAHYKKEIMQLLQSNFKY